MPNPQELIERLSILKSQRSNFDVLWDEVQHYVWPDGDDFLESRSPGEKTTRKLYDTTAANALDKFTAAMEAFLVPRHLRWHGLRAIDDSLNKRREVKDFFEQTTNRLFKFRELPSARFYGQMGENLRSIGAYGNGCLFVDENENGAGVRYRHIPIGKTWIEVDYNGIVDTVYYEYTLTAKAAAQKWPDDVPEKAAQCLDMGRRHEELTYLHVVMPNDRDKIDPESVMPEAMPFIAYDVEVESQTLISQPIGEDGVVNYIGGYFEMPYVWSRFTLNPNEIYGRGPAMLALPDILTLQEMEKTFLRSGHKVADPPLLVAHDGRLGRGRRQIRLSPGGLNYGGVDESGRPKIIPLQTGARLDITEEMKRQKRDAIFDLFFVKLFDILERDRVEMTATEVVERSREKGQLVTPVVGRQQSEMLGPMIEREISILERQGMLPPVPEALIETGGRFEIEYDTLATRMQQSDEMAAYQRLISVFQPQIEQDPSLMQVLRAEDAMREFGETSGIRASLFRSKDEMTEMREQQAQAQQAQQVMQNALPAAQAAKTISEIPTGDAPQ